MRPYPPVYFLIALMSMAGLHYTFPGYRWVDTPWRYLGFIPAAAGFAIAIYAAWLFRKNNTTIKPFQDSSTLVTQGPYQFTRNPMYLSLVMVLIGAGIVLGTVTCLIIPPLFIWLVTILFIRSEEAVLLACFGESYRNYRNRVRRWV